MTHPTAEATAIDPAVIAQENADARALNDEATEGTPTPTQDPAIEPGSSHQETGEKVPARPPNPREEIARKYAERRRKEREDAGIEADAPIFTESGSELPPALRAQQEAAARQAEEEAAAAAAAANDNAANANVEKPKSFKIKVNGNEHELSFEQLIEQAGLTPDEAQGIPTTALVRAAQINAAAQEHLTLAKSARKAARAPEGDTQPDGEPAAPDRTDGDRPAASKTPEERAREAIEKIQLGDPDEASAAFTEFVRNEARTAREEEILTERMGAVENTIGAAVTTFEAANADFIGDDDLAQAFYNGPVLRNIKAEIVRLGAPQASVDKALPDIFSALEVYKAAVASGKPVKTPTELLAASETDFRAKVNRPKPTPTPSPTATPAPASTERRDAKRQLLPQPSRSAAPPIAAAPRDGQSAEARKNVVAEMRKRRGQVVY